MNTQNRNLVMGGLAIAIIIAILAPFLASSNPDGLESAAEGLGVPESEAAFESPLPDYAIPGMEDNPWGGVAALILGVLLVVLVMLGLSALLSKRKGNGPE